MDPSRTSFLHGKNCDFNNINEEACLFKTVCILHAHRLIYCSINLCFCDMFIVAEEHGNHLNGVSSITMHLSRERQKLKSFVRVFVVHEMFSFLYDNLRQT